MDGAYKLNEEVTIAAQPGEATLRQLRELGYRSVVNFRTTGEPGQPLSPAAEGEIVAKADMEYLHVPVSMPLLGPQQIDEFREAYASLPKPVFAYCKVGFRAAVMVMMQQAVEHQWTPEEAFEQARAHGIPLDHPELAPLVTEYLAARR